MTAVAPALIFGMRPASSEWETRNMTAAKKEASKAAKRLTEVAGSHLAQEKESSKSERIARAFETAGKRTGTFESKYAKK